ncbi:hypothetical protein JCM10450v2_006929 [Rhodotorula kratochvilovae]
MSAVYGIYTSPHHPPVPDHLPTLIVTPHGRPQQVLYTYLHTNTNTENYLLTPSAAGDLCVAKLYPPDRSGSLRHASGGASSASHGSGGGGHVRCEASRGLGWKVVQTGIQNPIYKILLPNPEMPGEDQPLFQISKPNPNAPYWSLFYFAYAGHLIPPKRVEFGRIAQNGPEGGGGTRLSITGQTDEEKAVWASLGPGNEDAVEWLVVCGALVVLDDEIVGAAERGGLSLAAGPSGTRSRPPSPQKAMRVVAPVQMQSGVPRSASSSNLVAPAPGPGRGPSPSRARGAHAAQQGYPQAHHPQQQAHPDPRFLPPQQHAPPPPLPQQQHYAQQHQQQYPHPHPSPPQQQPYHPAQQPSPPRPHPSQQQQQQAFAPPPRSSSHAQLPPPGDSRQPSGYRPGSRPTQQAQQGGYAPPPNLEQYAHGPGGGGGEFAFPPGQQQQGQGAHVSGGAAGGGGRRLVKERR